MKSRLLIIAAAMSLAAPVLAHARYLGQDTGYTIITPGAPPTFVNPNYNGGYTVVTPGAPPTYQSQLQRRLYRHETRPTSDVG
jgi:hypothetical protein